jgi:anhydro-N-acetylmuramic acid kinase
VTLYIGLMSGTSADAVDAALVEFDSDQPKVLAASSTPLPSQLRTRILSLYEPGPDEIDCLGTLDRELAEGFASAALQLLKDSGKPPREVTAIGSHGQTVRHRPRPTKGMPFTLQIGDPNLLAELTGITTVADFRRRDMAAGGQGAPLAPGFHKSVFARPGCNRAVVNIGGIANITWLPASGPATGYDIGPGNGLMDAWIWRSQQRPFDEAGIWAAQGVANPILLSQLLDHLYFRLPPPKSTGREEFHWRWLESILANTPELPAADVQATLLELTAQSISREVIARHPDAELYVCGGGAHNARLMARLHDLLPQGRVSTTDELGIPPDYVEAVAFAWLAMRTLNRLPGNLPDVTGAEKEVVLGGIYPGGSFK